MEPKTPIDLSGYQLPLSTPTEAKKGGVLLYVKNGITFKPRPDLNLYKAKELESLFIEIINPTSKNTIIGTIYRHPSMNTKLFNEDFSLPNFLRKIKINILLVISILIFYKHHIILIRLTFLNK